MLVKIIEENKDDNTIKNREATSINKILEATESNSMGYSDTSSSSLPTEIKQEEGTNLAVDQLSMQNALP